MYRLLIVDDEPIIADGLYDEFKCLDHLELDVFKAYSGRTALEILNQTRIDIVITDIKMPGIDGMALMDKITSYWPECRVIFLTGYREFDYAYKAIQKKSVSFILKTQGYQKVIEAVESAIKEIEHNMKTTELISRAQQQLEASLQLHRKEYLAALLRGEETSEESIRAEFDKLGILFDVELPVLMAVGRIDHMPKTLSYTEKAQCHYTINCIMERYLSGILTLYHTLDAHSNIIWFLQPRQVQSANGQPSSGTQADWENAILFVKDTLETVQASCREVLGHTASFAVKSVPSGWSETSGNYEELKHLLDYRFGMGDEMLLTEKNIEAAEIRTKEPPIQSAPGFRPNIAELLQTSLERGEQEDFLKIFNEATRDLCSLSSRHHMPALEKYYSLAVMFMSYINKWSLLETVSFKIGIYKLMNSEEHKSWSEAVAYLRQLALVIFEIQRGEQENRANNTMSVIKDYINKHLEEEISLVRLADLVYFNPSYLSRLFKQQTGLNLTEYIQDARIRKAKELLCKHELRINDIAAAVRYSSSANFTRFFKKNTGMTPQEYRESLSKERE